MTGKKAAGPGKKQVRDSSISGALLRDLITDITSTSSGHKLQNGEYRKHPVEPRWHCPRRYELEDLSMPHFSMEYLTPKKLEDDRVVLQLHGGGYIGPMKNIYRTFATYYSRALGGGRVLTIDYRVAPEHPYPAALEDARAAYEWLLTQYPPGKIFVAGDSAGGGLAMALVHALKERGRPLPAGVIAMSPWTDLTAGGESYVTNFEKDPLFGRTRDSMLFHLDYVGEHDPKDPLISPLFGDFTGFPPMLIQVGSYEMLLSDSLLAAEKARSCGVRVRCTVYEGMFHVFQMARGAIPESRQAWMEIRELLKRENQGRFFGEADERKSEMIKEKKKNGEIPTCQGGKYRLSCKAKRPGRWTGPRN